MSDIQSGALAHYAIDTDHSAGDLAVYTTATTQRTSTAADTWAAICAIMASPPSQLSHHDPRPPVEPPAPPRAANPVATPLSIKLQAGDCTYLVSLAKGTRAAFGPGHHPIMILPPTAGRALLDEVGLVYVDPASKEVVFMPADEIPAQYKHVPAGAALTFRCNSQVLQAYWNDVVGSAGHQMAVQIPFFFNLYDTKTGKPVWTFGAHALAEHDHDKGPDRQDFRTHGGIHPSSPSQTLYL